MGKTAGQKAAQNSTAQNSYYGGQANSNAESIYGVAMPSITSMLNNPGYTPAQKTAITDATLGGIGATYGAANQGAKNAATETNNSAGLTGLEDNLARSKASSVANAEAGLQESFANDAQQQQTTATNQLLNLYGVNEGTLSNTLGNNSKLAGNYPKGNSLLGGLLGSGGALAGLFG